MRLPVSPKNRACRAHRGDRGRVLLAAVSAAVLAIVFAAVGRAEDSGSAAFSEQELHAKIQYCTYCHQPLGQGYLGATPIPRLAG
jgi:cytochrome c553